MMRFMAMKKKSRFVVLRYAAIAPDPALSRVQIHHAVNIAAVVAKFDEYNNRFSARSST